MANTQRFLQHLKEYRLSQRLSQKELRVQMDYSASAYSKLENGQRAARLEEILDIISELNIPAVELIYWLCDAGVRFRELEKQEKCNYEQVVASLKKEIATL